MYLFLLNINISSNLYGIMLLMFWLNFHQIILQKKKLQKFKKLFKIKQLNRENLLTICFLDFLANTFFQKTKSIILYFFLYAKF